MWNSGAFVKEPVPDKVWTSVFLALNKAKALAEVFAVADRLTNVVMNETDAEVALHSLLGVATTTE